MQAATTAKCELVYVDKDARKGQVTLHLPFSTPYDAAFSKAYTIAAAIDTISNAKLLSITIRYDHREENPVAPSVLSDVGYYLCLYYSNDVDYEPIFIPSPNPDVLETTGSFTGIRLDLSNPSVVALADALTTALAGTLAPDGLAWNRWLERGGRTL